MAVDWLLHPLSRFLEAAAIAAFAYANAAAAPQPLTGFYVHAADDAGAFYLTDDRCALAKAQKRIKHCTSDNLVAALNDPRIGHLIDGVSLDYDWADIEPAPGHFDFSYFSSQLAELARINARTGRRYRAILAVVPSTFPNDPAWYDPKIGPGKLPPWLFEDKAARKFDTISTGLVMINSCLPMSVAVPWDKAFEDQYASLIRAFGAYVAHEPHRELIAAVKLIGLVYLDELSHLPSAFPGAARPSCTNDRVRRGKSVDIPNDIAHWQKVGYNRREVLEAFKANVEAYKAAFPDTRLELSVTPQTLPPLDDEGNLVTTGPEGHPNIRSAAASGLPLIAIADALLGRYLMVSDHGFLNIKPNAYLSAYREAGGEATLGYGNGWLISNDAECVMTGGWRNSASNDCTGAWAMAQNLTEAELSGASYMVLDLADLTRPDYHDVLQRAHDFMVAHPDGAPRLATPAQEDFVGWSHAQVSVAAGSSALDIAPPLQLLGRTSPRVVFVSETPQAGVHELSSRMHVPKGGNYVFSIFAGLPKGVRNRLWVKVTVQSEGAAASEGVFALNGKVQESRPIPVDPASESNAAINGAPGAAQSNTFMNDHSWNQFVLQFRTPAARAISISIRLVAPNMPIRNGGGYKESYIGNSTLGVAFWAPQILETMPK